MRSSGWLYHRTMTMIGSGTLSLLMLTKKLQVFVSSTYEDLREERQAAVEGILAAGHIPAGMELFAADDQSQMEVIRRWIDESDVFLLILGGRYGSVDIATNKSYVQLEYEHAIAAHKPLFAVVIDPDALERKVRTQGSSVIEQDHAQQFKEFRNSVLRRVVRFWSDPRDIKIAILQKLPEYARREDLIGWVRPYKFASEANAPATAVPSTIEISEPPSSEAPQQIDSDRSMGNSSTPANSQRNLAASNVIERGQIPPERPPNENFVTAHLNESRVFAKYGLFEKAAEHLRAILDRYPRNRSAHDLLFRVLLDGGDVEAASAAADEYIALLSIIGDRETIAQVCKIIERGPPAMTLPEFS